mmetsp:Transcript_5270/g.15327  ORF Transcript_5270/g.15327 Transcript_5270/m.15327 type:complete len:225 (-) Transcript_5270:663-1337(-)
MPLIVTRRTRCRRGQLCLHSQRLSKPPLDLHPDAVRTGRGHLAGFQGMEGNSRSALEDGRRALHPGIAGAFESQQFGQTDPRGHFDRKRPRRRQGTRRRHSWIRGRQHCSRSETEGSGGGTGHASRERRNEHHAIDHAGGIHHEGIVGAGFLHCQPQARILRQGDDHCHHEVVVRKRFGQGGMAAHDFFAQAGRRQPTMPLEEWKKLQDTIPALHKFATEDLVP